jgi:hypothetical protein
MDFEGEGRPVIPQATKTGLIFSLDGLRLWSLGNANANLGIYNAVANNGTKTTICVRNKEWNKTIVKMKKKSLTHRYVQPKHY